MNVDKAIKSLTKIKAQLDSFAEKQDQEAAYLEQRLSEAKAERDRAKKISKNFGSLLS